VNGRRMYTVLYRGLQLLYFFWKVGGWEKINKIPSRLNTVFLHMRYYQSIFRNCYTKSDEIKAVQVITMNAKKYRCQCYWVTLV
jgi:hypothetical protein